MWFKNLQLYRLPAPWAISTEQLEASLTPYAFGPDTSMDMQNQGWDSPRQNDRLVHTEQLSLNSLIEWLLYSARSQS